MSQETRRKISIANKGRIVSKETRRKQSLSRIGKPNLKARGLKRTEEVKLKLRMAKLGKKQSLETIEKRANSIRGENHYNWKGGSTPLTRKRTKGFDWKIIADQVRLRDNNTCKNCGYTKESKLPVHHIIPFRISKDNSFKNLITLCNKCHKKFEDKITDLGYRKLAYKLIEKLHNGIY